LSETTDAAWWKGNTQATPQKRFTGMVREAHYVTTTDGTRLAVDVYLPEGLPPGERVPTVLIPTPYFRSMEFRRPAFERIVRKLSMIGAAEFAEQITAYGYANVVLDIRGTGASFGRKLSIMMPDAVSDAADVIDWIIARPWSNGRVGATGISGPGMIAQWITTAKHEALRAIAPRFTIFDIFGGTHAGGITASRFTRDIGAMVRAMDSNHLYRMPENPLARMVMRVLVKGLSPVDEDKDRSLLAEAVAEHGDNERFDEDIVAITYRDDVLPGSSRGGTLDTQSPATHAAAIEASGAAIYGWAGWYDGCFIREMLSLYKTIPNPGSRIVIGPWGHGGRYNSSPLATKQKKKQPTDFDHVAEMVRFFDLHLRDTDHGAAAEEPIHYFTMGEERWKSAATWPLPQTRMVPYYFGPAGTLTDASPPASDGSSRYRVDFDAGTGVHSRFGKHLGGGRFPARYPDRATRDSRLLVFQAPPFADAQELTGHPLVSLFVSATSTDAAYIVYLEDVAPNGEVTCIADGGLRASARAEAPDGPPYWMPGPFHRYNKADAKPLVPGEVVELRFDLYPVSWLFDAGHAVRVAIAGADKDNFTPIAQDQQPTLSVHHGGRYASRIDLPFITTSPSTGG